MWMNTMKTAQLNGRSMKSAVVSAAAALAIASVALPAYAQQGNSLLGSMDQPLGGSGSGKSYSTITMTQVEGDDTYTIKMEGDNVTAQINGKDVPKERIRRKSGRVEILGDNDKVVHTFNVRGIGNGMTLNRGGQAWTMAPQPAIAPEPPVVPQIPAPEDRPPVMVGITMDDSEEGGITITSVVDGLPAAKAGILEGDVIKKIDGKNVEGPKSLREVLKAKNPGDKLDVVVHRGGEEKNLTLDLVAFDSKQLRQDAPVAMSWGRQADQQNAWSKEATEALTRAMKELEKSEAFKPERLKAEIMRELELAMKAVEEAQNEAKVELRGMLNENGDARSFVFGPNAGQRFVLPRGQAPNPEILEFRGGGSNMNERLDRLEERLDKLTSSLERLAEQLEKKNP